MGCYDLVVVRYPDATNFEGRKILLFECEEEISYDDQKALDPHFCDEIAHEGGPVLLARFRPTDQGLALALQTTIRLSGMDRLGG